MCKNNPTYKNKPDYNNNPIIRITKETLENFTVQYLEPIKHLNSRGCTSKNKM